MRKCPRENCGGDLFWERDEFGNWEEKCLLCSRIIAEFKMKPLPMNYGKGRRKLKLY